SGPRRHRGESTLAFGSGRRPLRTFRLLRRGWHVLRTRALWGWRFHRLGARSVLGRKLLVNHPAAVSIGSRVTLLDQFILADLCRGRWRSGTIVGSVKMRLSSRG